MGLFVLGDTHFSESVHKPMDIFGGAWIGHREKLIDGLSQTLRENDTFVMCGDFSWGMSLEEALPDFKLLASFPGRKILLKGNHDYWWTTVSKMDRFLEEHNIKDIFFLHNNCYYYEDIAICGTRGWFAEDNEKIYLREIIRMETSLKCAQSAQIFTFLHYPPIFGGYRSTEMLALFSKYGVKKCFYGHLHGDSLKGAFRGIDAGITYIPVSADAINFTPVAAKSF